MAILQSLFASGQLMAPVAGCAAVEVVQHASFALPATPLQVGDIIELGILPGGNVPTDAIAVSDDLDSGTSLTFDIGIMSGEVGDATSPRTCGSELFAASAIGQTGGVARATAASAFTIAPTSNHRSVGVKVTAAPQTQVAGAKLRLILKYAAI